MYEATKSFIYRAKLYSVGQVITDGEYQRMTRDKVAAKRGIPEMIAPQRQEPEPEPVVTEPEPEQAVSCETKKPNRRKKKE